MPPVVWQSPDLLARVRTEIQQPSSTDFPQDADIYTLLGNAQNRVLTMLSITVPESQYGAPFLLTSADGGFTFTFGLDADGNAIFPFGEFELYRSLNAVADSPMEPGTEFLTEGDRIRIPGNLPYAGPSSGPYCRMLTPGLLVDASHAPIIKPVQALQALVYLTASDYFRIVGDTTGEQAYEQRFEKELDVWMVAMRDQAEAMDAIAGVGGVDGQMWYTGLGGTSRWW